MHTMTLTLIWQWLMSNTCVRQLYRKIATSRETVGYITGSTIEYSCPSLCVSVCSPACLSVNFPQKTLLGSTYN